MTNRSCRPKRICGGNLEIRPQRLMAFLSSITALSLLLPLRFLYTRSRKLSERENMDQISTRPSERLRGQSRCNKEIKVQRQNIISLGGQRPTIIMRPLRKFVIEYTHACPDIYTRTRRLAATIHCRTERTFFSRVDGQLRRHQFLKNQIEGTLFSKSTWRRFTLRPIELWHKTKHIIHRLSEKYGANFWAIGPDAVCLIASCGQLGGGCYFVVDCEHTLRNYSYIQLSPRLRVRFNRKPCDSNLDSIKSAGFLIDPIVFRQTLPFAGNSSCPLLYRASVSCTIDHGYGVQPSPLHRTDCRVSCGTNLDYVAMVTDRLSPVAPERRGVRLCVQRLIQSGDRLAGRVTLESCA